MSEAIEALVREVELLRAGDAAALEPLPFPSADPGPDASTVRAHLQRLHECMAALVLQARATAAECVALRQLPPPPPIGEEMLAAQRAELEDLRALSEVHKRQIGALVFEKGRLNGTLQKRDEELNSLGEEKAAVVAALSAALRRVTEEREEAQRAGRQSRRDGGEDAARRSGAQATAEGASSAQLAQMVASQKRTIEGLRKELARLRPPGAEAEHGATGRASGEAGSSGESSGDGGAAAAPTSGSSPRSVMRAASDARPRTSAQELEHAREQAALALLHYQSDRASMGAQLRGLRAQVAELQEANRTLQEASRTARAAAATRQRPGEAAHLHRPVGAGGTHTVDISPASLPAHSESPALRAFTHGRASQWSLWSVLASLAIGRSRPHQLMSV